MIPLIKAMRPRQWIKNLLVFAPLIFAFELSDPNAVAKTIHTFIGFCLLSGGTYLVNDVRDMERDRSHPTKSRRPIASGELSPTAALAAAAASIILGFAVLYLGAAREALIIAGLYLVLQAAYNLGLRGIAGIDVIVVALGFVLRAVAGAEAIAVPTSSWLILCTFLGALRIAMGKRRAELVSGGSTRDSLGGYTIEILDSFGAAVSGAVIIAYSLYTFTSHTANLVGRSGGIDLPPLLLTLPWVVYGLFRYEMLLRSGKGEEPDEILLYDRPLLAGVIFWALTALIVLYLS